MWRSAPVDWLTAKPVSAPVSRCRATSTSPSPSTTCTTTSSEKPSNPTSTNSTNNSRNSSSILKRRILSWSICLKVWIGRKGLGVIVSLESVKGWWNRLGISVSWKFKRKRLESILGWWRRPGPRGRWRSHWGRIRRNRRRIYWSSCRHRRWFIDSKNTFKKYWGVGQPFEASSRA